MKPLYLPSKIKNLEEIEAKKRGFLTSSDLIPLAVSKLIKHSLPQYQIFSPNQVILLRGPGNNGKDGFGLFEGLKAHEKNPQIQWLLIDEKTPLSTLESLLNPSQKTLVIDAVFGSGFHGPQLPDFWRKVFETLESFRKKNSSFEIWAIDSPSGLDCERARPFPGILRADRTFSIGYPKYCHELSWIKPFLGKIDFLDLNFEFSVHTSSIRLIEKTDLQSFLPRRTQSQHKGSWMRVEVLAGSPEFPGACYLASLGAFKVGAPYVYVPKEIFDAGNFLKNLPEAIPGVAPRNKNFVRVVGPGWGLGKTNTKFLESLISENSSDFVCASHVFDADALVLLSKFPQAPDFFKNLKIQNQPILFTPHPGEALALLGLRESSNSSLASKDRIEILRELQKRWGNNIVFILKGSGNLIAQGENIYLSPWGSVAMANAGHGDLLSGLLGGLLAQGLNGLEAAICGLSVQGLSAESLLQNQNQQSGILAHEVAMKVPSLLAELTEDS